MARRLVAPAACMFLIVWPSSLTPERRRDAAGPAVPLARAFADPFGHFPIDRLVRSILADHFASSALVRAEIMPASNSATATIC
jgi:hypothetical protein